MCNCKCFTFITMFSSCPCTIIILQNKNDIKQRLFESGEGRVWAQQVLLELLLRLDQREARASDTLRSAHATIPQ